MDKDQIRKIVFDISDSVRTRTLEVLQKDLPRTIDLHNQDDVNHLIDSILTATFAFTHEVVTESFQEILERL